MTAYFVYGAQSVDDYSHAMLPTIEYFEGKPFDLPPWRSPLLVWSLIPAAHVAKAIGIDTQFGLIRFLSACLGVFSLWGVWAFFQWAKLQNGVSIPVLKNKLTLVGSQVGASLPSSENPRRLEILIPLYLVGLHFLMTFVSTRAFGEVIAMTLVLVGFLWMDQKKVFWGGLLLGIACLYRFQIGILGVGFLIYFLTQKNFKAAGQIALAGALAGLLQAGIDLVYGRFPLETLYAYLYVNKDGAVDHSIQPWYNTWATVVPILFLPFSGPFFRKFKGSDPAGNATEKLWWVLILIFVALHSMIPHKEERFLYPILPLLLILLGRLWARSWGSNYEKYVFRPLFGSLLVFGLVISSTSNSQSAEYEPVKIAEDLKAPVIIWDNDSVLRISFFRHRLVKDPVSFQTFDVWPGTENFPSLQGSHLILVTSNSDRKAEMDLLDFSDSGWLCYPSRSVQSIGDHWIYWMNPKKNVRRRPTWVRECFFQSRS